MMSDRLRADCIKLTRSEGSCGIFCIDFFNFNILCCSVITLTVNVDVPVVGMGLNAICLVLQGLLVPIVPTNAIVITMQHVTL